MWCRRPTTDQCRLVKDPYLVTTQFLMGRRATPVSANGYTFYGTLSICHYAIRGLYLAFANLENRMVCVIPQQWLSDYPDFNNSMVGANFSMQFDSRSRL